MERTDAQKNLKALGFRVDLDMVVSAVQRFQNGDSLYSIYTEKPHFLSKVTARKIRDMFNNGKLGFILDLVEPSPLLTSVIDDADALTMEESCLPANMDAPQRRKRLSDRFHEIRQRLPDVRWNIGDLENSGLPADVGLQLLAERDILLHRLYRDADLSHKTVERFVALHYIAMYYLESESAAYEFIVLAATTYAKGLIDGNLFLMNAGEGIVRYQVWRGPEFLNAFVQAQQPTLRERARLRILEQDIEQIGRVGS